MLSCETQAQSLPQGGPSFGDEEPPGFPYYQHSLTEASCGVEAFHPHPADNAVWLAGPKPESPDRFTMP